MPIQLRQSYQLVNTSFSFDLDREASAIEYAVERVLQKGYRTIDIMSEGKEQVSTRRMGDLICNEIGQIREKKVE